MRHTDPNTCPKQIAFAHKMGRMGFEIHKGRLVGCSISLTGRTGNCVTATADGYGEVGRVATAKAMAVAPHFACALVYAKTVPYSEFESLFIPNGVEN